MFKEKRNNGKSKHKRKYKKACKKYAKIQKIQTNKRKTSFDIQGEPHNIPLQIEHFTVSTFEILKRKV